MGEFYQDQLNDNRALNEEPIMSDYGSNFEKYSDAEKARLRAGTPGAPPVTPNTAGQNLALLQKAAAEVAAPKVETQQDISPGTQNRSGKETVPLSRGGGKNVIDRSGRPGPDATVRPAAQQGSAFPGSAMDFMNAGLPGSASDMATAIPAYRSNMTLGDIAPEALRSTLGRSVPDTMQQKPPKIDQRLYGLGDYRGIYSTPRRTEI